MTSHVFQLVLPSRVRFLPQRVAIPHLLFLFQDLTDQRLLSLQYWCINHCFWLFPVLKLHLEESSSHLRSAPWTPKVLRLFLLLWIKFGLSDRIERYRSFILLFLRQICFPLEFQWTALLNLIEPVLRPVIKLLPIVNSCSFYWQILFNLFPQSGNTDFGAYLLYVWVILLIPGFEIFTWFSQLPRFRLVQFEDPWALFLLCLRKEIVFGQSGLRSFSQMKHRIRT